VCIGQYASATVWGRRTPSVICVLGSAPVWLTPTVGSVTNVNVDSTAIQAAGLASVMAALTTATVPDNVCHAATSLAETTAKGTVRKMLLLLLGGELLAERCRTDDLMPSISLLCLPPCRVNPEIL